MAKTTTNVAKYRARVEPYAAMAEAILRAEVDVLSSIQPGDSNLAPKKLTLADEMLNLVSCYVAMNGISQVLMKSRDEDALNSARKALFKSIVYLEDVVTGFVDASFSDYKDKLDEIEAVEPAARYALVRKMGLAIDLLANAYADNTKWRWTIVELKGRFAVVAKNLINLDQINANSDFRSPHYEPTVYHLRMAKKLLAQAAERYREKYELSSKSVEDFNKSLSFLSALRRLSVVTGARDDAETIKKKMEIWSTKLASDIKLKAERKK